MTQPWLAQQAVWASTELTPAQKLVWHMTQQLDQGPDGCWMGAGSLGLRIGAGADNVKHRRADLVAAGLLRSEKHPGKRTASWYALWPDSVKLPASGRLDERSLMALRDALDGAIRLARELAAEAATGDHSTPVQRSQNGDRSTPLPPTNGDHRPPVRRQQGTTDPLDRGPQTPSIGDHRPPRDRKEMGVSSAGESGVSGKCVSTTHISGRASRARSERSHERDSNRSDGPQHIGDIDALRRFG